MLRFQSLDGWRGLAAVFVALYHLNFLNHLHDWSFLRHSYLFVDFFFVLSGFVITHAYKDRLKSFADFGHFINRRLSRLMPLHIFILMLFVILEVLKLILLQFGVWDVDTPPFTHEYSTSSLLSNVFLMHSMGLHDYISWNYPSWSISVEFYTYILFAAVGVIGYKYRSLLRFQYVALIVLSFYILYQNTHNLNDATNDFGFFRCIIGFFLGGICYRVFLLNKSTVIPHATLVEFILLVYIYFFVTYFGKEKLSIIAPFIFMFTVYVFSFEQGFISKLLKAKPIQRLGQWSYSIYMVHALLILIIGRSLNVIEKISGETLFIPYVVKQKDIELVSIVSPYFMDLLTVIFLAVLIYLSSLTYKYIELRMSNISFLKITKRLVN